MNETNETIKAPELIGINLDVFPDWTGPRVARSKKIMDGIHKLVMSLPITVTEEECQAVYGRSHDAVCERGAVQISYSADTPLANMIKEDLSNGINFGEVSDVTKYTNEIQSCLSSPPTAREGKRAVEKAQAAEYRALGLEDANELAAMKEFMSKRREKQARKAERE